MSIRSFARAAVCIAALACLTLTGPEAGAARPRPDRTPPSAPTNLRVTAVTQTSVSFAWNPSTDNVGLTSYSLWPDGLGIGVVSVAHPQTTGTWSTGLRPGQTYTFRVRAFDAAYNGSADATVTVTTPADTTAPTTPSGLSVQSVEGSKVLLRWTNGVDDLGPVTHQVLVNGVPTPNAWSTIPAGSPHPSVEGAWVRQLEPGTTYQLSVRAVDGSGNASGVSPAVSATTAPNGDVTAPTTPTLLRVSDGGTSICPEELELAWTASTDDTDTAGAIEYEVRINGRITDVLPYFSDVVIYTDVFGANSVTVTAVDRAGNASAPSNARTVNVQWGVDYCG